VTGGGVDNIKLIRSGRADIGFANASVVQDALQGADKFSGSPVKLRTLAAIYPNRMHVVTLEGRGIATMADLKGKRVSTGAPGSGTEVIAFRILEAYGLDKDRDIRRERLSAAESANALKDGKIDAFIFGGAMPVAAITDLAATPGVRVKLVEHGEAAERMNEKYGRMFARGTIPAGAYPGHGAEVGAVDVYDLIVVGEGFDEDLAYRIAKLMFESRPDLIAIHRNMEFLNAGDQRRLATAPLHPGVLRYLAEIGVTN